MLINPAHTYPDLFMPIDALEKTWYDAIDGERTIGGLVEASHPVQRDPVDPDRLRGFFERLWWYDQVVFDLTKT